MKSRTVHEISDSDGESQGDRRDQSPGSKRSRKNPDASPQPPPEGLCPYGALCYRTSPQHVRECRHPSRELGFFLTKCDGVSSNFNASSFARSLRDVLAEETGDILESAVHFSYIFDMEWLVEQYPERYRGLPMLLVVQQKDDLLSLLIKQRQVYRNFILQPVKVAGFGTHHTKMISLKYKNSLRIIVTTANLYGMDWGQKTQMLWVSPVLKRLENGQGPDSETGFRAALKAYLRSYELPRMVDLAESYSQYDFSPIQEYFIASSPKTISSGLRQLKTILTKHLPSLAVDCPLTFCFSSIGSLGSNDNEWLLSVFAKSSLASATGDVSTADISISNIKAIYPTVEEVRQSLEGYEAGRSLPYSGQATVACKVASSLELRCSWAEQSCSAREILHPDISR